MLRPLKGNSARQAALVVAMCASLLLVLRVVTIGQESAESFGIVRLPVPTPTADEECESFARFWMDMSGSDPEGVAAVSLCRFDGTTWRLVERSPGFEPASTELGRAIGYQLDGLRSSLSLRMRRNLDAVFEPVPKAGTGHTRIESGTDRVNQRYRTVLKRYLQDPANSELADFADWLEDRRDAEVAAFLRGCEAYPRMKSVCAGLARAAGQGWAPWPWELGSEAHLADYLRDAAAYGSPVAGGERQAPDPT